MKLLELITQEPETRITCSFDKIGMDGCIPMIDAQILLGYVFNDMFITADKVYPLFLTVPLNDTNFPNLYDSMADMNMVQNHLKEILKTYRDRYERKEQLNKENDDIVNYIEDLVKNGKLKEIQENNVWSKKLPPGSSKTNWYNTLTYDLCDKLTNNGILYASSSITPVFIFSDIWKAYPMDKIVGTYLDGYLKDIPVYISPYVDRGDIYYVDKNKKITKYKIID